MLQPDQLQVETVGGDIAWMRPGEDGRLRAHQPQAGFGVLALPPTRPTPINGDRQANSIFTNVALTDDGDMWGKASTARSGTPDRLALQRLNPESGRKAAHPNSRFTVPPRSAPSSAPTGKPPRCRH